MWTLAVECQSLDLYMACHREVFGGPEKGALDLLTGFFLLPFLGKGCVYEKHFFDIFYVLCVCFHRQGRANQIFGKI